MFGKVKFRARYTLCPNFKVLSPPGEAITGAVSYYGHDWSTGACKGVRNGHQSRKMVAEIGGYVGLFLGISFYQFTDVITYLFKKIF